MRIAALGSGSAGNSLIIESGGRRLLVDAGFSCRQLGLRLESLGDGPDGPGLDTIEGLLLTHEHSDHCRGADVLARRHGVPVYGTAGTLSHLDLDPESTTTHTIRSGQPFEVAPPSNGDENLSPAFRVEPFSLPHDAREPVGFVIEDDAGHRLGLAADLGCRSQLAWARLVDLDVLVLETNHDLSMLRGGPYPWHLKQRVASRHGHLSNREAAEGVRELVGDRLQHVMLYHLSRTNNHPTLAAAAVGEVLDTEGSSAAVVLTEQDRPTSWIQIAPRGEVEE